MLPASTQFAHSSLMFPVIVILLLRRALLAVPLVLAVVTPRWRHVEDVGWHMVLPVATLSVFLLTRIAGATSLSSHG
jgi:hypothetical protein